MISMAKSMTVGKRENEKKRLAKREEKLKKKESKKLSGKANSFEDMIAYVDENGMITSTPPTEDIKKEEINPDEIIIATPKKEGFNFLMRLGDLALLKILTVLKSISSM